MKLDSLHEVSAARRLLGVAAFMAALVAGSSCGGGGGGSCGKVQPCGGSVVGAWKVADVCVDATANASVENAIRGVCPTVTVTTALSTTGNLSFNADGSYAWTGSQTGTATVGVPQACLMQGGLTLTCAEVGPLIMIYLLANPNPYIQGATCVNAGSGCTCNVPITPMNIAEAGTYSTPGTSLIAMPSTGAARTYGYCAKGSDLHLTVVDMSMPASTTGQAKIVSDIVLKKQ